MLVDELAELLDLDSEQIRELEHYENEYGREGLKMLVRDMIESEVSLTN